MIKINWIFFFYLILSIKKINTETNLKDKESKNSKNIVKNMALYKLSNYIDKYKYVFVGFHDKTTH